jgi:transposase-like protein
MIGRTISHYRILAKLGEGGMGEVYRARDTKLDREIAIKVLPPELAWDPERLERFEREAKAVAALNHPNIVTIYSVEDSDGVHFITMELVEGRTLAEIVTTAGFSLDRFFDLALPLADAVSSAHSKGVVHRDLKPANIMLDQEGRLKILDFGLAKLFDPAIGTSASAQDPTVVLASSPTVAGSVLGTADYMSPEQAEGKPVDHRSDLFSLGIILYEVLTGKHPFRGDSQASTISALLRDIPEPVSEVRPALPRHLGRIIGRCLDKQADSRYQSALDLRIDLERLKRETESALTSEEREATAGGRATWRVPRSFWIAGVAIVATVAIALGFWQLRQGGEPPRPSGDSARKMIVVLPFDNLGPAEEEYFSDGITDAITARLASIRDLGVISRQSATLYKGTDKTIRQIGRATRRKFKAEEKIRIVLEGLRGEESISELCRREGIAPSIYYKWSKEFLEAGKQRLMGDTKRQATSPEVGGLRRENAQLKELVADLSLKNVVLKKSLAGTEDE